MEKIFFTEGFGFDSRGHTATQKSNFWIRHCIICIYTHVLGWPSPASIVQEVGWGWGGGVKLCLRTRAGNLRDGDAVFNFSHGSHRSVCRYLSHTQKTFFSSPPRSLGLGCWEVVMTGRRGRTRWWWWRASTGKSVIDSDRASGSGGGPSLFIVGGSRRHFEAHPPSLILSPLPPPPPITTHHHHTHTHHTTLSPANSFLAFLCFRYLHGNNSSGNNCRRNNNVRLWRMASR